MVSKWIILINKILPSHFCQWIFHFIKISVFFVLNCVNNRSKHSILYMYLLYIKGYSYSYKSWKKFNIVWSFVTTRLQWKFSFHVNCLGFVLLSKRRMWCWRLKNFSILPSVMLYIKLNTEKIIRWSWLMAKYFFYIFTKMDTVI